MLSSGCYYTFGFFQLLDSWFSLLWSLKMSFYDLMSIEASIRRWFYLHLACADAPKVSSPYFPLYAAQLTYVNKAVSQFNNAHGTLSRLNPGRAEDPA